MKYSVLETIQPLETKTIQTHLTKIGDIHITTVLVQVIFADYSYYSLGVHTMQADCAEFRMISDVARNEADAEKLFRFTAMGEVTPCTLEDILRDCIGAL